MRTRPEVAERIREYLQSDRNPFRSAETRTRATEAHRSRGYAELNGGNGQPLPEPQRILAAALLWPTEYVIRTGNGYQPAHYKIDIAEPTLRIAIEVDGVSHQSLRVQMADRRKTEFLRGCGWVVLRFSNSEILNNLSTVLALVRSTTLKRARETTSLTDS